MGESAIKHPFERWMAERGYLGVQLFPVNPGTATAEGLLTSGLRAVTAYERGQTVPYVDRTR